MTSERRDLAAVALLANAAIWGLAWLPLRWLQAHGLHPLWATAIVYALAVVLITLVRPRAWAELARHRALWLIVLFAGGTNASFNWGVTVGDVVRVVLLFYLMPLWAVLLGRVVLGEPITRAAALRVAMALAGAALVLWPAHGVAPQLTPADLLGLSGGLCFACNNILLRREAARGSAAKGLAMFLGGCLVALLLALALAVAPPPAAGPWLWGALALAAAFMCGNLALQYGASRLPASTTAVIMVTEVLWATGSALLLGAGSASARLAVGGGLIIGAALLAALPQAPKETT